MVESTKKLMVFEELIQYVMERFERDTGNQLDGKRNKVESLIINRMRYLGDLSPDTYFHNFLKTHNSEEYHNIVSGLTVHHTYFFREFNHFEYLLENLSSIVRRVKSQNRSTIKVLSAGCSMGHEVYSLACFFEYHLRNYPSIKFEVHGYDVDKVSVQKAQKGVYALKELKNVPQIYISGFWQKSTNPNFKLTKIKENISAKVKFSVDNLLEPQQAREKYDIIFCRNVLIYFDTKERIKILKNLERQLEQSGEIFLGSSDFVPDIVDLKRRKSTIYAREILEPVHTIEKPALVASKKSAEPETKKIRILIVDDSPTTRKLLRRIFERDHSFEVAGEAANGLEASDFLKSQSVDVMTLDIHMPKQNGLEYMRENYSVSHPRVVVISGASREDVVYSKEIIKAGASDFVEKPTMANFTESSEEIRAKVKSSLYGEVNVSKPRVNIFQEEKIIYNVSSKLRSFVFAKSSLGKLKTSLQERANYKYNQPPTLLFFEGSDVLIPDIIKELEEFSVEPFKANSLLSCNKVYITSIDRYQDRASFSSTTVSIFGSYLAKYDRLINLIDGRKQVLLEEQGETLDISNKRITNIVPSTSFYHLDSEFLADIGDSND